MSLQFLHFYEGKFTTRIEMNNKLKTCTQCRLEEGGWSLGGWQVGWQVAVVTRTRTLRTAPCTIVHIC